MERKKIINNLKSDGALFRCQGIALAAIHKMADEETVRLLRELKKDRIWILGRQVGWYAIAALDFLGVEKYSGNDPEVLRFVSEFPVFLDTIKDDLDK